MELINQRPGPPRRLLRRGDGTGNARNLAERGPVQTGRPLAKCVSYWFGARARDGGGWALLRARRPGHFTGRQGAALL